MDLTADEQILDDEPMLKEGANLSEREIEELLKEDETSPAMEIELNEEDKDKEESKNLTYGNNEFAQDNCTILNSDDDEIQEITKTEYIEKKVGEEEQICSTSNPSSIQSKKNRKRSKEPIYLKQRNIARKIVADHMSALGFYSNDTEIIRMFRNQMEKRMKTDSEAKDSLNDEISKLKKENEQLRQELNKEKVTAIKLLRHVNELDREVSKFRGVLNQIVSNPPKTQPISSRQMPRMFSLREDEMTELAMRPMNAPSPSQINQTSLALINRKRPFPIRQVDEQTKRCIKLGSPEPSVQLPKKTLKKINELQARATESMLLSKETTANGRQSGHNLSGLEPIIGRPLQIIDHTTSTREIYCLVPFVPLSMVQWRGNRGVIVKPSYFLQFPNNKMTIHIKSTRRDFLENWQIGGWVDYSKMAGMETKVIQIFFQICSMRTGGISGVIAQTLTDIDWGNSSTVETNSSGKTKFRITFHRDQDLPHGDKISIFAVAFERGSEHLETSTIITQYFT